jgi:hypothetical protein
MKNIKIYETNIMQHRHSLFRKKIFSVSQEGQSNLFIFTSL